MHSTLDHEMCASRYLIWGIEEREYGHGGCSSVG